jgi:hypothetical protein
MLQLLLKEEEIAKEIKENMIYPAFTSCQLLNFISADIQDYTLFEIN